MPLNNSHTGVRSLTQFAAAELDGNGMHAMKIDACREARPCTIQKRVQRERSWENITKGVESRFFADAVKRFDRLLADMEAALSDGLWLAGKEFSLADVG